MDNKLSELMDETDSLVVIILCKHIVCSITGLCHSGLDLLQGDGQAAVPVGATKAGVEPARVVDNFFVKLCNITQRALTH